jgi:hypothetical protein
MQHPQVFQNTVQKKFKLIPPKDFGKSGKEYPKATIADATRETNAITKCLADKQMTIVISNRENSHGAYNQIMAFKEWNIKCAIRKLTIRTVSHDGRKTTIKLLINDHYFDDVISLFHDGKLQYLNYEMVQEDFEHTTDKGTDVHTNIIIEISDDISLAVLYNAGIKLIAKINELLSLGNSDEQVIGSQQPSNKNTEIPAAEITNNQHFPALRSSPTILEAAQAAAAALIQEAIQEQNSTQATAAPPAQATAPVKEAIQEQNPAQATAPVKEAIQEQNPAQATAPVKEAIQVPVQTPAHVAEARSIPTPINLIDDSLNINPSSIREKETIIKELTHKMNQFYSEMEIKIAKMQEEINIEAESLHIMKSVYTTQESARRALAINKSRKLAFAAKAESFPIPKQFAKDISTDVAVQTPVAVQATPVVVQATHKANPEQSVTATQSTSDRVSSIWGDEICNEDTA